MQISSPESCDTSDAAILGIQTDTPQTNPTWHIASYPRSGNHLVRTLLEYAARRPTLGCPGTGRDTPIYARDDSPDDSLLKIDDTQPVAFKSHFPSQILAHEHHHQVDRFLLITRAPCEAITSHLARDMRKRLFVTDRHVRKAVERELDSYLSLLYAFRAYPSERRVHVQFEALTAPPKSSRNAAKSLLTAMGLPISTLFDADWDSIRNRAKNSQISLGQGNNHLRSRLRAAVTARVSQTEVRHFIGNGVWGQ